jgi:hypothetical protein
MFRCKHHHQGAHYLSLLKLQLLNNQLEHNGMVNLVVWLHMLSGPCWCVCRPVWNQSHDSKQFISW